MKRRILSLVVCLALLLVTACGGGNNAANAPNNSNNEENAEKIVQPPSPEAYLDSSNEERDIYSFMDKEGAFVIRVVNKTDKTMYYEGEVEGFNADEESLGVEEDSITPVGPGQEGHLLFEFDESLDSVVYNLNSAEEELYVSVAEDLSYETESMGDYESVTVTNNGTEPAILVKAFVTFYEDGDMVYFNYDYFEDEDEELKPGASVTMPISSSFDYDAVEISLMGDLASVWAEAE